MAAGSSAVAPARSPPARAASASGGEVDDPDRAGRSRGPVGREVVGGLLHAPSGASCASLVGSRSPKTVPRVWSVSCWRQRASMPVPENSTGVAVQPGAGDGGEVGPRALDERARVGQAALVALVELAVLALGQRAARGCRPRRRCAGRSSSGQSKTNTARSTPIWQAARPTPSAAYIVATMSATRAAQLVVVGRRPAAAARCMTGSPQRVIGSDDAAAGERAVRRVHGVGGQVGHGQILGLAARPGEAPSHRLIRPIVLVT